MSRDAEVGRICPKAGFAFAEVLFISSREGLFGRGVVEYTGQGYGARLATFRVPTGGKWVVGVFLEEDFYSCQQVFPLQRSGVINKRSCPKVLWGILGRLNEEDHVRQGLHSDFHPLLR